MTNLLFDVLFVVIRADDHDRRARDRLLDARSAQLHTDCPGDSLVVHVLTLHLQAHDGHTDPYLGVR